MKSRFVAFLVAVALVLVACSTGGASTARSTAAASVAAPSVAPQSLAPSVAPSVAASRSSAAKVELIVFAAASLKGALEAAKPAYETANPGVTVLISTDASSALATKIEQGAPSDVFLSADTTNPQKLVDKGLTRDRP